MSLKALLDHVAARGVKDDYLSSLASRLARIDKQCGAGGQEANRGNVRRRSLARSPARS